MKLLECTFLIVQAVLSLFCFWLSTVLKTLRKSFEKKSAKKFSKSIFFTMTQVTMSRKILKQKLYYDSNQQVKKVSKWILGYMTRVMFEHDQKLKNSVFEKICMIWKSCLRIYDQEQQLRYTFTLNSNVT